MSVDFVGLGALVLVSLEWLALGWLSGVRFAQHAGNPFENHITGEMPVRVVHFLEMIDVTENQAEALPA